MLRPFVIIAGPTAVGKSEIAVAVARACGGEIVGADAFQIYAGLDLLTAKPSAELRSLVPHHLIGEIPLTQAFDVAQYLAAAEQRFAEIHARGRLPIVCGGTGLYLRALTRGLAELPPADAELRTRLEHQPLTELDPDSAAQIDRKNPRRVIRAVEVCILTGKPFSSFREQWAAPDLKRYGVVLTRDRAELHDRIATRTEAMFADGVIEEVERVSKLGPTAEQVLGLREISALLAGEMTRAECSAAIQQATRRYAKRQMTWFRREPALEPVNFTGITPTAPLIARIAQLARDLSADR